MQGTYIPRNTKHINKKALMAYSSSLHNMYMVFRWGFVGNNFFLFTMQNIILGLYFFYFFYSVHLLLFVIFLFTLIIFNYVLFLISSLVVWFLKFIFKFSFYFLNCYLFCFESISWLICFFYNSTPRHLFSFNFCVKFGPASFNC